VAPVDVGVRHDDDRSRRSTRSRRARPSCTSRTRARSRRTSPTSTRTRPPCYIHERRSDEGRRLGATQGRGLVGYGRRCRVCGFYASSATLRSP
jgi:hypothetical protein